MSEQLQVKINTEEGVLEGNCPKCNVGLRIDPDKQEETKIEERPQTFDEAVPVLWVKDDIVFPGPLPDQLNGIRLQVQNSEATEAFVKAVGPQKPCAIVLFKGEGAEPKSASELHEIATLALLGHAPLFDSDNWTLMVHGLTRVKLAYSDNSFRTAIPTKVPDEKAEDNEENQALFGKLRFLLKECFKENVVSNELLSASLTVVKTVADEKLGILLDLAAYAVTENPATKSVVSFERRAAEFAAVSVAERLKITIQFLEQALLYVRERRETEGKMRQEQENAVIRETISSLSKKLGGVDEAEKMRQKIESSRMPDEVKQEALRACQRWQALSANNPESGIMSKRLEWFVDLPWGIRTGVELTRERGKQILENTQKVLDEDHYGLRKVKKSITEQLSVQLLNPDAKAPIICLVGPPGVGKTSLGKSIARSLDRKFVRISLGGVKDEAEIRGHRSTYIGALPGKIIHGLKQAGAENPVFMLDEVDKLGADGHGDPSSALLEVLDPEQNHSFTDHYLAVPFNLRQVLFICTANRLENMQPALRDRFNVIVLDGYTSSEKLQIAERHLIPKQLKEHGFIEAGKKPLAELTEDALSRIVREYTREAGVRNFERHIVAIYGSIAKKIVSDAVGRVKVSSSDIPSYLGPPKFLDGIVNNEDKVGRANALAWSPTGGTVLPIECELMDGKGTLEITGNLEKVIKESAQVAVSFTRSHAKQLGVSPELFRSNDIHIHAATADSKDGPSAGVPLAAAVVSAFSRRPIRHDIAATGEIMLGGDILPIGGLKEKFLAALQNGMKTVIYPQGNHPEVEEICEDPENKELLGLDLKPVRSLSEALELMLLAPTNRRK